MYILHFVKSDWGSTPFPPPPPFSGDLSPTQSIFCTPSLTPRVQSVSRYIPTFGRRKIFSSSGHSPALNPRGPERGHRAAPG